MPIPICVNGFRDGFRLPANQRPIKRVQSAAKKATESVVEGLNSLPNTSLAALRAAGRPWEGPIFPIHPAPVIHNGFRDEIKLPRTERPVYQFIDGVTNLYNRLK